jgi:replication initiation and membrane attachment protein DnaB
MYSSGLLDSILSSIPESESLIIENAVEISIASIYKYKNSVLGLLDIITNNYASNETINLEEMEETLQNLMNSPLM